MLLGPERMMCPDVSGRHQGVVLEVNWNREVSPCKFVKVRIGDNEAVVKEEHLNSLIFAMANEQEQPKFLHGKVREVREYPVRLRIKASRDISKGEDIVLTHKMMIPIEREF